VVWDEEPINGTVIWDEEEAIIVDGMGTQVSLMLT
jgi:hypothetical protein